MSKLIRDLFQTQQPDGSYRFDMTNIAYSAIPWILGIFVYIAMGVFKSVAHPDSFQLVNWAAGFAALFAGGGIGVMFHSKSQV